MQSSSIEKKVRYLIGLKRIYLVDKREYGNFFTKKKENQNMVNVMEEIERWRQLG